MSSIPDPSIEEMCRLLGEESPVSEGKHFNSKFTPLGSFAQDASNDAIKSEPMFFNCDAAFAVEHGEPITRSFFAALPEGWLEHPVVFDSRVHMLMPGWYPAIPGFHHDDVPRPPIPAGQHFITAGQPDYETTSYFSQHIFGLVNASIAPTEFAVGECVMPKIKDGELVYRRWHEEVERLLADGKMQRVSAPDRQLIHFDWQAFHQGTKAVSNGWRWFGRLSANTARTERITNEIRHQVQVYLEFPMEGW